MQGQYPRRDDFLESVPQNRRDFIKKMAAVAFAVPVVGAFSMDSVALAAPRQDCANQRPGERRPGCDDDRGDDERRRRRRRDDDDRGDDERRRRRRRGDDVGATTRSGRRQAGRRQAGRRQVELEHR